jgi:hypothetical protein
VQLERPAVDPPIEDADRGAVASGDDGNRQAGKLVDDDPRGLQEIVGGARQ